MGILRRIIAQTPGYGLRRSDISYEYAAGQAEAAGSGYYLLYFGINQPRRAVLPLPKENRYHVNIIDTWNMTIADKGVYTGHSIIDLPSKQYILLQIQQID